MRLAIYAIPAVIVALLSAYMIWIRPLVLDIPVVLRCVFSFVPALVLYRAADTLYTLLAYREYLGLRRRGLSSSLLAFLLAVIAFGCIVLHHVWRDVKWADFRFRRPSVRPPSLGSDTDRGPG